jgi:hypothetical protein
MPQMSKQEFMERLSDQERWGIVWDWLDRLSSSDQRLGLLIDDIRDRVTKVEGKVAGSEH